MASGGSRGWGRIVAAFLGAAAGGVAVLLLSRTIPRMMSGVMSEMMRNMVNEMGGGDCDPAEM